ncbi:MAG TPA: hypothetical protein VFU48_15515 [Nitrospira sp.]|nr:hypothetical protein [Nitrospira sp.]
MSQLGLDVMSGVMIRRGTVEKTSLTRISSDVVTRTLECFSDVEQSRRHAMMRPKSEVQRYFFIAADVLFALLMYRLFGWIGAALWIFFVLLWVANRIYGDQHIIMETLLSRLPDRCAMCHREILDEGGIVDGDGIYHAACSDRLEVLRKIQGH